MALLSAQCDAEKNEYHLKLLVSCLCCQRNHIVIVMIHDNSRVSLISATFVTVFIFSDDAYCPNFRFYILMFVVQYYVEPLSLQMFKYVSSVLMLFSGACFNVLLLSHIFRKR
jgi:hypothetical protein